MELELILFKRKKNLVERDSFLHSVSNFQYLKESPSGFLILSSES